MEEKSQLEETGDGILFFLIQFLIKECEPLSLKEASMDDSIFIRACDNAANSIGITLEYPIDHNYINALKDLNLNIDFSSKRPNEYLKRPERGVYSFDYDEYRTEFVRRTYRNSIVSYSKNLVEGTIEMMENEGSFSYYDGEEVDADYYDGETTETKFDKDSIRKIG